MVIKACLVLVQISKLKTLLSFSHVASRTAHLQASHAEAHDRSAVISETDRGAAIDFGAKPKDDMTAKLNFRPRRKGWPERYRVEVR